MKAEIFLSAYTTNIVYKTKKGRKKSRVTITGVYPEWLLKVT
jgi:hypothetical protein